MNFGSCEIATLHYIKFRVKNAEALQSLYRQFKTDSQNKPWKGRQEQVKFSLVLKVCREFDDITLAAGKLFHVCAGATRNTQLLTVDSRVG